MLQKVNEKVLVSFDYSITSPAMSIWDGKKYQSFVVSSEKRIVPFENDQFRVTPILYPIWSSPQERYQALAESFFPYLRPEMVFSIESYSMGSKGRVFDIAEATQTLKYLIWTRYGKEMAQFPPTTVKKHFTGKGNADKERMAEAFFERFGFWMHEAVSSKVRGSASDLVDSVAVNVCLQL